MTGSLPFGSFQKAIVGLGNASTLHSKVTESPAAAIVMPDAWIVGTSIEKRNKIHI